MIKKHTIIIGIYLAFNLLQTKQSPKSGTELGSSKQTNRKYGDRVMLKTQRNMKAPVAVAAGVILALGFSSTVSAVAILEEVTQLIHFDDANNGASTYTTADGNFYFAPTNFQSSTLCADDTDPPGNGSCLIESRQGGKMSSFVRRFK